MAPTTAVSKSGRFTGPELHEKQQDLLCGQHALNNLIQECIFSAESLAMVAHKLDEMELAYMADNNEGGVQ